MPATPTKSTCRELFLASARSLRRQISGCSLRLARTMNGLTRWEDPAADARDAAARDASPMLRRASQYSAQGGTPDRMMASRPRTNTDESITETAQEQHLRRCLLLNASSVISEWYALALLRFFLIQVQLECACSKSNTIYFILGLTSSSLAQTSTRHSASGSSASSRTSSSRSRSSSDRSARSSSATLPIQAHAPRPSSSRSASRRSPPLPSASYHRTRPSASWRQSS